MRFEVLGRDKQGPVRLGIEMDNPFDAPGRWLRGSFHCHVAQLGDAEAVCEHYQRLGFQFLGSSDYNQITAMPASTADFVTFQGAEIFDPRQIDLLHVICTGLTDLPRPLNGQLDDVRRLVGQIETDRGLAILAHPFWSDYSWSELTELAKSGIAGFEVSNRLCQQINGKGRADQIWQLLLNAGHEHLAAIGADDANAWDKELIGQTWTAVLASECTPEGILEAVRQNRTYASEGPHIQAVRVDPSGYLEVETSPCLACHFMSRGFGVRSVWADRPTKQFRINLAEDGYRLRQWLSVCIEDDAGRRAWSSAIPVKVEMMARDG